ncbi:unnamed protein product [Prorocentrum cordatum]|uniref:Protein translocase subunit SecA n=1 Tax=Prorocentrum cordatum TaxID=2364126 RepID=A0ABN9SCT2_9DINO|nr:unnamed protein product [Polarella glacialis]
MGGIVLHEGGVAEMATGEGKTLAAILPAFLHSLGGDGVHVVTTNDYLARRDAESVGQALRFLGASVGFVQEHMDAGQRQQAYGCDVTYVTNVELAFDYLRDQMALSPGDLRLRQGRPFHFAIVDEVDSVLIDEARSPVVISATADRPSEKYAVALQLAGALRRDVHYTLEEKQKLCTLTEAGVVESQRMLRKDDLFDPQDPWAPFVVNALSAREFYARDKEYILRDGKVVIVDGSTGRPMSGRRWRNGLHQAIEAKEGVQIEPESMTLATVSYQSFFRLFEKLAGMTGTAATEAQEFEQIYDLKVSVVPTNRPCQRKEGDDQVYMSDDAKWSAVARDVQAAHLSGRPVLVGTTSVESSERLSGLLDRLDVPHRVLNARPENAANEAEIVARGGRRGAVTIATNMAGRGTDIVLGGSADYLALLRVREALFPLLLPEGAERWAVPGDFYPAALSAGAEAALREAAAGAAARFAAEGAGGEDAELRAGGLLAAACQAEAPAGAEEQLRQAYELVAQEMEAAVASEREALAALGGLYVVGTERHESRRIDNQLRGRAGRQGDPGEARFFLSLTDSVFRVFGGDAIGALAGAGGPADVAISSPLLSGALDEAQQRVEGYYSGIRKEVFDYDCVMDQQRKVLYDLRRKALLGSDEELQGVLLRFNAENMEELSGLVDPAAPVAQWPFEQLSRKLSAWFTGCFAVAPEELAARASGGGEAAAVALREWMLAESRQAIQKKFALIDEHGPGLRHPVWRQILLMQIDKFWRRQLQNMEFLRDAAKLRAYGQQNPLTEFKMEGYKAFLGIMGRIRRNSVYSLFTFMPQPLVPVDAARLDTLAPPAHGTAPPDAEAVGGSAEAVAEDARRALAQLAAQGQPALLPLPALEAQLQAAGVRSGGARLRWAAAAPGLRLLEDEFARAVYVGLER